MATRNSRRGRATRLRTRSKPSKYKSATRQRKVPSCEALLPSAIAPHDLGRQLRLIVGYLQDVESYVICARMALDGQRAAQDCEIAALLSRAVGNLLFDQIRDLAKLASKCDGLAVEPDYESGDDFDSGDQNGDDEGVERHQGVGK